MWVRCRFSERLRRLFIAIRDACYQGKLAYGDRRKGASVDLPGYCGQGAGFGLNYHSTSQKRLVVDKF
jgi:hypothetical protein